MNKSPKTASERQYRTAELWSDGVVHALGGTFATVGSAALVWGLAGQASGAVLSAAAIYLFTLVASIGISATYNIWPEASAHKQRLRRFDHSAIYLLIAGTYTPFLLRTQSWMLMAVVWLIAAVGIFAKLAAPGRLDGLSIVLYLGLGWSGVSIFGTLVDTLSPLTFGLLLAGGLVYSLGVPFHLWERLPFQNAIWHAFVLTAAGLHFSAVWLCSLA
ncbi:PAQR family membrane homeostasis protein TrhA [Consotaella salsifontis]|uniref:Hemolysin III n=1 Tax=Consotaella salsifontis TaxID=1365950 RepID=A0A1T4SEX6_9HYPH|nr:hemolysin III [Consotaella salsifontis]